MPDQGAASEFGGAIRDRRRIYPLPHQPTAAEKLMLVYTTGDETGALQPDNGEAFNGLNPEEVQRALRESEGVMEKGQYAGLAQDLD